MIGRLSRHFHWARKTGKFTMQLPSDKTVDAIRDALRKGQHVLLVGGPSGLFGQKIQRDNRFLHYVSTQASRKDNNFHVQPTIGCVLVTRYIDASLTRVISDACAARHIPHFGTFRSGGMVQRTVEIALALPQLSRGDKPGDIDLENEEAEATAALAKVDRHFIQPLGGKSPILEQVERIQARMNGQPAAPPAGLAPAPVTLPAKAAVGGMPNITEIRSMFTEARAALDLTEEAVVKVLNDAATSLKALRKLERLRAAMDSEDA